MASQYNDGMAERARVSLISLSQHHGDQIYNDPRRCEALLRDYCPEHRREIGVLIGALKQGVPARLRDGSRTAAPFAMRRVQAIDHLQHELLLTEPAARWAVDVWAAALGLDEQVDRPPPGNETVLHSFGESPAFGSEGQVGHPPSPQVTPPPIAGGTTAYPGVAPAPAVRSVNWRWLLFSFRGRATRSDYWLRFSLPYIALYLFMVIVDAGLGTFDFESGIGMFSTLFSLAAVWPSLAVAVKRCHDRDKSGWYVLLILVPIIGLIWMLIELGCLRGTIGDNRFGKDPLLDGS